MIEITIFLKVQELHFSTQYTVLIPTSFLRNTGLDIELRNKS